MSKYNKTQEAGFAAVCNILASSLPALDEANLPIPFKRALTESIEMLTNHFYATLENKDEVIRENHMFDLGNFSFYAEIARHIILKAGLGKDKLFKLLYEKLKTSLNGQEKMKAVHFANKYLSSFEVI